MEQKKEEVKSSEEKKKEEPGGFIVHDEVNPYKLMLVVDVSKVSRMQMLGLAEEFKEQAKMKALQMLEEKRKLNQMKSKFSFKQFVSSLKK